MPAFSIFLCRIAAFLRRFFASFSFVQCSQIENVRIVHPYEVRQQAVIID
jgi:hypothetical protein